MAAGLTQEALADAAVVDRTTLSDLERGKRRPTYPVACRIAAAVGRAPEDIWRTFGSSQPRDGDPLARRLRLERGLSQRAVAILAHVSVSAVRRAEEGRCVHPRNAKRLADFFGVRGDELQAPVPIVPTSNGAPEADMPAAPSPTPRTFAQS